MVGNRLNVAKSIKRITVLHQDPTGFVSTTEIHGRRRRKKKQSKGLRGIEKLVRKVAKAQRVGTTTYLDRHRSANRRKRDGWARKLPANMMKAQRKSARALFR